MGEIQWVIAGAGGTYGRPVTLRVNKEVDGCGPHGMAVPRNKMGDGWPKAPTQVTSFTVKIKGLTSKIFILAIETEFTIFTKLQK